MKRFIFCCILIFAISASAGTQDLNSFFSEEGNKWNVLTNKDGLIRSLYGQGLKTYSSPGYAADHFLTRYGELLGIQRPSDLKLVSVEQSEIGTDVHYRQYYGGLPVVGGIVSIHLDLQNRIVGATSEYKRNLRGRFAVPDTFASARKTAQRLVKDGIPDEQRSLMLLDTGDHKARPVWKMEVDSTRVTSGSWQVYVDAQSPNSAYFLKKTHADANGVGNVWEQNPVVTPARQEEKFKYMDESKKLFGNFARVYDANFIHSIFHFPLSLSSFTTASDPNRRYDFNEGDARLTEAMAYFHINRVRDRWTRFGFHKLNGRAPIFVNVTVEENGRGYDNAFYSRSRKFRKTGIYVFGAGHFLENLGLDSDVYYHEYGHGVLDHTKPHFLEAVETNYPGAFHEAFGDISAAAITENSKLAEFGLRSKTTHRFGGRNLNNNRKFPQDVVRPGFGASEVHYTGEIIGGAWWELEQTIGSFDAQKILFKSLPLMPAQEIDFFDVRDAMLTADVTINHGVHQTAIMDAFSRHGLSGDDPGQPGIVTVTSLKTARLNLDTNRTRLTNSFKKGDVVLAILGYDTSSDLMPGYNLIPVDVQVTGVCDSCLLFTTLTDEAKKGSFRNRSGAWQVVLFTDDALPGDYTITLTTRLGGTQQISPAQTAHFTIR